MDSWPRYPETASSLNEEVERLLHPRSAVRIKGFFCDVDDTPATEPAAPPRGEPARGRPIRGRRSEGPSTSSGSPATLPDTDDRGQSHRGKAASGGGAQRKKMECSFCKRNGETRSFYSSHTVRDRLTGNVVCPVLRKHVCELCGATGDDGHTRSYCPRNRGAEPNMVELKKTRRNSTHQRRST